MDLRPNSERPAETDVSTFLTGLTQVIWSSALGAGFAAAAAYLAIAAIFGINHLAQGPGPHFIYLADAFLHGKLFLLALPGETTDLVLYGGEYYVYYPPLPALVCLPLVALLGTGFSDTILTIALGGLNVSLVSVLLSSLQRDGLIVLSPEKKAWLTAFFALGTVHLSTAPHPSSCGMASLLGFAMLCGSYIASLRLSGLRCALVAGTLVACAFASRNTLILPGLWVAWYLLRKAAPEGQRSVARTAFWGSLPVVGAFALMAMCNNLRFGSPSDVGFGHLIWNRLLAPEVQQFGAFNLHYLPGNVFYTFLYIPYLSLLGEGAEINFWMGGQTWGMACGAFLSARRDTDPPLGQYGLGRVWPSAHPGHHGAADGCHGCRGFEPVDQDHRPALSVFHGHVSTWNHCHGCCIWIASGGGIGG